jgi:hypothetical protein
VLSVGKGGVDDEASGFYGEEGRRESALRYDRSLMHHHTTGACHLGVTGGQSIFTGLHELCDKLTFQPF